MKSKYTKEEIDRLILTVLIKKKRSMTAKQLSEELMKYDAKISRPIIASHLRNLSIKGKIKELKKEE